MVHPREALGGGAPGANWHNHLESPEMAPGVPVLPAVIQPEDAERENAIDDGAGLGLADADHGLCSSSAKQVAAYVRRAKAVFQVHRRAHAIDLRPNEV